MCSLNGDKVIINVVLKFPDNDYFKILVNFEFLYGICLLFLLDKEWITFPNADKERFIFFAYYKVFPSVLFLPHL